MEYKLVAVDMDGTLLNDSKEITNENLKAITKAKEMGVKFVIASGRVQGTLKYYEGNVAKNQPMICCNGAIIVNEEGVKIYSRAIDKKSLIKVVEILRNHGDMYFHFYDNDVLCSEKFEYAAKKFYEFNKRLNREQRLDIRIIKDAIEYFRNTNNEINKIVVMDEDDGKLNLVRKRILEVTGIDVTKSDKDNIEIVSKGVSKGNALKILADYYNIPMESCVAVGNDENDISMIKQAGMGVVVSNAREFVKDNADYVTENDNNKDAISEVINKFIVKPLMV